MATLAGHGSARASISSAMSGVASEPPSGSNVRSCKRRRSSPIGDSQRSAKNPLVVALGGVGSHCGDLGSHQGAVGDVVVLE